MVPDGFYFFFYCSQSHWFCWTFLLASSLFWCLQWSRNRAHLHPPPSLSFLDKLSLGKYGHLIDFLVLVRKQTSSLQLFPLPCQRSQGAVRLNDSQGPCLSAVRDAPPAPSSWALFRPLRHHANFLLWETMSVQFAILLYVVEIELHSQPCSVAPNTVGLGGALKGEREPQWRCFIPSFNSGYKNDSIKPWG